MGEVASKALLQQGQILKEETLQENYFFRQIYYQYKEYVPFYLERLKQYYEKLQKSQNPFLRESAQMNLFIDDVYNKYQYVMRSQLNNNSSQINNNSFSCISCSDQLEQQINRRDNEPAYRFFYGYNKEFYPETKDEEEKKKHYQDVLMATNLIDESFKLRKKNHIFENTQQIISKQFQQFLLFQGQPDQIIGQIKLKHLLLSYLALPFRLVLSTFVIILFIPISIVWNIVHFVIEDENYQERQQWQKNSKKRYYVNQNSFFSFLICCNQKRLRNFDKYFNFSNIQSPVQILDFVKFWAFSGILVAYFLMKKLLPDNNIQDENMRLIIYFVIIQEILFLLLEILSKYSNTNTNFDTSLEDKQQILERLQISDEDLQIQFMRMPVEIEIILQLDIHYLKDIEDVLKNEELLDFSKDEKNDKKYEYLFNRLKIVRDQIYRKRQIFNGMSVFYQYLFTPNENGLTEQTIGVDKDYLKLYEKRQEDSKKKFKIEIGGIKNLIHWIFYVIKQLCIIFMIITVFLVILQYSNYKMQNEQVFNYMKKYSTIIFIILFDFECNSIQVLKQYRNSLKRLTSLLIYDRTEENKSNYDISNYELPCINLFSLKSINTWYNMRKLTFQQNLANKNIIMLHCLLEFTVTLTLIILFWPTLYSFYTVQSECEGQSITSTNLVVLIILFYRIIIKSLFQVVYFFCEINSAYYEHIQILQDIASALNQTLDNYTKLQQNFNKDSDKQPSDDDDQQKRPTIEYFQYEAVKQIQRILKYQKYNTVLDQLEYSLICRRQDAEFNSNRYYNRKLPLNSNLKLEYQKYKYEIMKSKTIKSNLDSLIYHINSSYKIEEQDSQEKLQQEKKYLKQLIQQYEIIIKDLEENQKQNQLYFLNIIPINKDQVSGFAWIFVPLLLSVLLKLFKKGDFSFIKDLVDEIWSNLT
ncbi:hypothetical protein ABPG74_003167 [Tetrahymena malaccensis]